MEQSRDASASPYRLCVAANRDEYFHRPAQPLHFWDAPDVHILGGSDDSPGKENGTWMATNTINGKVGVVLNVRDPNTKDRVVLEPKYGRGSLIPEYLRSDGTASEFAKAILSKKDHYDPFLLLLLEPKADGLYGGDFVVNTGTECTEEFFPSKGGKSECFGFSNTYPIRPLMKVKNGLNIFRGVVEDMGDPPLNDSEEPDESVVDDLLKLLSSADDHYPDQTLDWSFPPEFPESFRKRLSSVFVDAHEKNYGTRAQTVLFVDFKGNGFVLEKDTIPDNTRTTVHSSEKIVRMRFVVEDLVG